MALFFGDAEGHACLHASPEPADPGRDRSRRHRQIEPGIRDEIGDRCFDQLVPGQHAGHQLAAQFCVVETRAHQLHQQAHITRLQVVFVEVAGLLPFFARARAALVHARLALEQGLVHVVEHRHHELLLAPEVVADQRVVDTGVAGDVAHVQPRVAGLAQAPPRRGQDQRAGRRAVGACRLVRRHHGLPRSRRLDRLNNWFIHLFNLYDDAESVNPDDGPASNQAGARADTITNSPGTR